jgi:hypothetical protein
VDFEDQKITDADFKIEIVFLKYQEESIIQTASCF